MIIVLLPGLDGTGALFSRMVEALSTDLTIHIVDLNQLSGFTYREQAKEIADRFKRDNALIVAESYSGRIAYELCDILKERVLGVVFIASFISAPSIVSKWANLIPVAWLRDNRLNRWFLQCIGFANLGNRKMLCEVLNSISSADRIKLKWRMKNLVNLEVPTRSYNIPCL